MDPLSASSSSSHLKLVHAPVLATDEPLAPGTQHGIYHHEVSNDADEDDDHLEASLELPSQVRKRYKVSNDEYLNI
jgi:hypothetical protein